MKVAKTLRVAVPESVLGHVVAPDVVGLSRHTGTMACEGLRWSDVVMVYLSSIDQCHEYL